MTLDLCTIVGDDKNLYLLEVHPENNLYSRVIIIDKLNEEITQDGPFISYQNGKFSVKPSW